MVTSVNLMTAELVVPPDQCCVIQTGHKWPLLQWNPFIGGLQTWHSALVWSSCSSAELTSGLDNKKWRYPKLECKKFPFPNSTVSNTAERYRTVSTGPRDLWVHPESDSQLLLRRRRWWTLYARAYAGVLLCYHTQQ